MISWVKGILGCILLMSLVLQGISGKAYSPYLRLFMGILLILTVLSPITDPTGVSGMLEDWMDRLAFREDQDLADKLLQGEAWLEGQIMEKAEEFAAESSQAPKGEQAVIGTEAPEGSNPPGETGIKIEIEVEIDPVVPVVPVGGTGGE